MRVTLNSMEMAGLNAKVRQWEKETGEKVSLEFALTILSGLLSDDIETYIAKVFDIKRKMLEEQKKESSS